MPTTQPQVKVGDILKVTNEGSKLFRGMWDLVDYVIPPSGSDFLPFEAVKLFFGDPRATTQVRSMRDSRGIVSFIPDRAAEVRRLRLLYSHGFGDFTGQEGPEVVWEKDRIPQVTVETLQGERIYTVIDDPAGHSVLPASATQADDTHLRDLVEQQGKLIRSLLDRMGMDTVGTLANQEIPEDMDPQPLGTNMFNPATDEIEFVPDDSDPAKEPEMFDDLPEDR